MNEKESHGFFVSLEGLDFTGKSTLLSNLNDSLIKRGLKIAIARDPPYYLFPWSNIKEDFGLGNIISPLAEALLLLTARIDNYERFVLPKLNEGKIVISDRSIDSWFAYQSVRLAPYLGGKNQARLFLFEQNDGLIKRDLFRYPDLTILIEDDPSVIMQRVSKGRKLSKYEVLNVQVEVRAEYQRLKEMFPERIITIEASGKGIQEVFGEAEKILLSKYYQN